MYDPRDIRAGQLALSQRWLSPSQAQQCLEFATRAGRPFAAVAVERALLSRDQAAQLEAALSSHAHPAPDLAPARASPRPSSTSSGRRIPLVGDALGGYTLLRRLGEGGMGAVFEAERGPQRVALKVITTADETARKRFAREAEALAQVDDHPHIVRIFTCGVDDDQPYVAMELVEGRSLEEVVDPAKGTRLTTSRALEVVARVAEALAHIHARGILHRDIKPGNILIRDDDGSPLLTDFGLARIVDQETLTRTQEVLGTPHYMAPEQVQAESGALSPATDIWALGVLLYQLLAGGLPFEGDNLTEIAARILFNEPPPPSRANPAVSRDLDTITLKCLEKDPQLRYASAAELAADCQAALDGAPITGSRSGFFARARRRMARRSPVQVAGAALLLLTLLAAPLLWRWMQRDAERRARSQAAFELAFQAASARLEAAEGELVSLAALHLRDQCEALRPPPEALREALAPARAALEEGRALPLPEPDAALSPAQLEALVGGGAAATFWRRLATVQGLIAVIDGEGFEAAATPPAWRELLSGLEDLRCEDLGAAASHFERQRERLDGPAGLARLGEAVLHLRAGEAREGRLALREAAAAPGLREALAPAVEGLAFEDAFAALTDPAADAGALRDRFAALESLDAPQDEVWARFNADLARRLEAIDPRRSGDFEAALRAALRLEASQERWPRLAQPELSGALHEALGDHHSAAGSFAAALHHYLQVQRRDPSFTLPAGFRIQELGARLGKLFFERQGSTEALEEFFEIILAMSRAQIYLPIVSKDWLDALEEAGVLARTVERFPEDPYPRFWRGFRSHPIGLSERDPAAYERVVQGMLADLSFAIEQPEVPDYFVFIGKRRRAKLRLFRARERGLIEAERPGIVAELLSIDPNRDPEPDEIYRLLTKARWEVASPEQLIADLDETERWLTERFERSNNQTLHENRPPGAHLTVVLDSHYESRLSEISRDRMLQLIRLERYEDALADFERVLPIIGESEDTWKALPFYVEAALRSGDEARLRRVVARWGEVSRDDVQDVLNKARLGLGEKEE